MTHDADAALLLLRLAVGGFQLPHGLQKFGLLGGDVPATAAEFDACGLVPPRLWVRAVGLAQIFCGGLLVGGLATRGAALLTFCLCLGMAQAVLRRNGWFWHRHGMEYALFWALGAAALVLLGPGAWSVEGQL
jgi:putative oxidoreductase